MTVISTPKAPAALGPYSQAIIHNDLIFASGQIPLDPQTGTMVADIESQAHQAFQNVQHVLEAANYQHVLKTTVFLTNLENFGIVNEIYAQYFTEPFPARSCVEVSKLPKGALIEIEVVATTK